MPTPRDSRPTFDAAVLAALHEARRAHPKNRAQAAQAAAGTIRPIYEVEMQTIELKSASANIAVALVERSTLIDQLLQSLFAYARDEFPPSAKEKNAELALIAVGGYGRRELFPYSDIDLLFLQASMKNKHAAHLSEFILYVLWGLGLKVGHAVRSIDEAYARAEEDMTIRTAMLDARMIAGDAGLLEKLALRLRSELFTGSEMAFVEAKLAERDRRHERMGGTRYALEPNVKEGKGGLRDLHSLGWIVQYAYPVRTLPEWVEAGVLTREEMKAFLRARDFLWQVRTHLHRLAGRAEERLTFDYQKPLAALMGYGEEKGPRSAEGFMKRYFQTAKIVGTLTHIVCAVLEDEKKRKPSLSLGALLHRQEKIGEFVLSGTRLAAADEKTFAETPVQWFRLFALAQTQGLHIHPRLLRVMTHQLHRINREFQKNAEANALFVQMLTSPNAPELTLRRLGEAGILAKFIPDFGRVIGQMQYDRYHTLTVDEHTLCAIGMLNAIETGAFTEASPIVTEIIHQLESKRVLYLALFCHDIAKGRGGDHSALGEKIARKLAIRFGFSPKEQEDAAWLVAEHLLFSHTAFKRDIADDATVRDFVAKVQSPERLRLLLVLTVADIRAVGPAIWNGWKGALLRELYRRAESMMGAGSDTLAHDHNAQLTENLRSSFAPESTEEVEQYLALGYPSYWMGCDAEEHARIFNLLKTVNAKGGIYALDTVTDDFRAITQIILVTPDQHALFSKIAGAMALAGASIVSAKAFTLKNGMAVDLFGVQDSQGLAFDRTDKFAKLHALLERSLTGQIDFTKELASLRRAYPNRADVLKVPAAVFIENTASAAHTVIEVNGRDRIGFLHSVTQTLAGLGLNIATAIVSTYGDRAVDVFYVKDVFGLKITHEVKLKQIREALQHAIAAPDKDRKAA